MFLSEENFSFSLKDKRKTEIINCLAGKMINTRKNTYVTMFLMLQIFIVLKLKASRFYLF